MRALRGVSGPFLSKFPICVRHRLPHRYSEIDIVHLVASIAAIGANIIAAHCVFLHEGHFLVARRARGWRARLASAEQVYPGNFHRFLLDLGVRFIFRFSISVYLQMRADTYFHVWRAPVAQGFFIEANAPVVCSHVYIKPGVKAVEPTRIWVTDPLVKYG